MGWEVSYFVCVVLFCVMCVVVGPVGTHQFKSQKLMRKQRTSTYTHTLHNIKKYKWEKNDYLCLPPHIPSMHCIFWLANNGRRKSATNIDITMLHLDTQVGSALNGGPQILLDITSRKKWLVRSILGRYHRAQ